MAPDSNGGDLNVVLIEVHSTSNTSGIMGYAGYAPTKYPPGKPSEVQAALWAIQSVEALEVLGKLTKNVVVAPGEEKYRKIRLSNPKIQSSVVQVPMALEAMLALGWTLEDDNETLTVPLGQRLTMAEVRAIEDAKDKLRKEQRTASRSGAAAAAQAVRNLDKARVQAQLESDRMERTC